MAAALDAGTSTPSGAGGVAGAGRFLGYLGLLGCVGGVVYLSEVHHGTRREIRRIAGLLRLASLAVVVGTLVQAAGRLALACRRQTAGGRWWAGGQRAAGRASACGRRASTAGGRRPVAREHDPEVQQWQDSRYDEKRRY